MPFANHGSLITCLLQEFGHGLLASVEIVAVVAKSVFMAVLTREHAGAAWSRNGVGHVAVAENKSFLSYFVNVGCGDSIPVGIGTDSLTGMIVGHDVDDVERFVDFGFIFLSSAGGEKKTGADGREYS